MWTYPSVLYVHTVKQMYTTHMYIECSVNDTTKLSYILYTTLT
jgi:hypothetical protein